MLPFWLLSIATALVHAPFNAFNEPLSPSSFLEQFNYSSLEDSNWVVSHSQLAVRHYTGQWALQPPHKYPGFDGDNGLVLKTPSAFHGISTSLDEPFENVDTNLVLQYEVKPQSEIKCSGMYIKLLDVNYRENGEFSDVSPFQIMFGPDICGANNKVKFILNKRNVKTGITEQKHLVESSMAPTSEISALYTLILKPNSDFEIRINGQVVYTGNAVNSPQLFSPEINPPKLIDDVDGKKPADWDDEELIPDPDSEKPEDYDARYNSALVPDPNEVKPDGWLDDELEYILDPFAEKPQEWIDEEDGQWEPPIIRNPKCLVGCGKWEPLLVPNKEYKGPWIPPMIPNPNYKGKWIPHQKLNPDYYEDKTPFNLEPIGGLGFELWSIDLDILFDNIYLGHSIEEAEALGNSTFLPKLELEHAAYKESKPKPINPPAPPPKSFEEMLRDDDDLGTFQQIFIFFFLITKRELLNMKDLWYDFNRDPLNTLVEEPLKAFVYSGVALFVMTFTFGLMNVIAFMLSSWTNQIKDVVNDAKESVGEETKESVGKETKDVPKIVELDDEGKEIKEAGSSTSAKVSKTSTRRRK